MPSENDPNDFEKKSYKYMQDLMGSVMLLAGKQSKFGDKRDAEEEDKAAHEELSDVKTFIEVYCF